MVLFSTKRCNIRFFQAKDIERFMSYRNDPVWMKYQGFKGLSRTAYEKALLSTSDWKQGVQLAVTDKEDFLIGDLYVREDPDQVEIGFSIAPEYARRGYMAEAVCGLLTYLREISGKPVIAETDPENEASIRFLRKLGFQYAGRYDGWEQYRKELFGSYSYLRLKSERI